MAGLKPGEVLYDFNGWQPAAFDREDLLFLYSMPPEPGSLESFLAKEG